MKDNEARTKIAVLEEKIKHLRSPVGSYEFDDLNRRFSEVVKELGFSFDDDLVFTRDVKSNSVLGRLQAQILALVEALGLEETYEGGVLVYKKRR